jgi:hypothetical protein
MALIGFGIGCIRERLVVDGLTRICMDDTDLKTGNSNGEYRGPSTAPLTVRL